MRNENFWKGFVGGIFAGCVLTGIISLIIGKKSCDDCVLGGIDDDYDDDWYFDDLDDLDEDEDNEDTK